MSAKSPAHDEAINAALQKNWNNAVSLNISILQNDAENIDALNRLGYAYIQLGKNTEAKNAYTKVITIDQYNQIAHKHLIKLQSNHKNNSGGSAVVSPLMFLEEPGKTKIVPLINLAPANVLATCSCGQTLTVKIKKHCIEIRDESGTYLGALPDDISFKLIRFIEGNNSYALFIRSIGKNVLSVFIRELARGEKYKNQPSFTPSTTYVSQGRINENTEKPDTTVTGEEKEE